MLIPQHFFLTIILLTCTSNSRKYFKSSIIPSIKKNGNNFGDSSRSVRSSIVNKVSYLGRNTTHTFKVNNVTSMASFKLFCKLGAGHYAGVYKVQKIDGPDKGRFYALKVTPAKKISMGKLAKEYEILDKFHHPFILNITYIFRDPSYAYAVTDVLTPFKPILKAIGQLNYGAIQFYIAELVLAVQALHSKGVVHNDIYFDNMLLNSEGHVVLADFGESVDKEVCDSNGRCPKMLWLKRWPFLSRSFKEFLKNDFWAIGNLFVYLKDNHI